MDRYGNMRISVELLVFQSCFIDDRNDVAFAYTQFLVLSFSFSEFQYLVDQVEQPDSALMDYRDAPFVFSRECSAFLHVLQRTDDECQGCTQFVRNVCKESQAFIIKLLLLFMTPFFGLIQVFQIDAPFIYM